MIPDCVQHSTTAVLDRKLISEEDLMPLIVLVHKKFKCYLFLQRNLSKQACK